MLTAASLPPPPAYLTAAATCLPRCRRRLAGAAASACRSQLAASAAATCCRLLQPAICLAGLANEVLPKNAGAGCSIICSILQPHSW